MRHAPPAPERPSTERSSPGSEPADPQRARIAGGLDLGCAQVGR